MSSAAKTPAAKKSAAKKAVKSPKEDYWPSAVLNLFNT
jgi:hypothetical protein